MLASSVLITLAGLFSSASAASSSCSFSTTISASSALSGLNSCPTLDGSIEITGDSIGSVDLSSVQEVSGKLIFNNSSSITEINFSGLEKVTGSVSVEDLTQLHSILINNLSEAGLISLISLPSLALFTPSGGFDNATSIVISDTALSSLEGFNFDTIGTLDINNNKNITSIELDGLKTVTENLILSFNSDNSTVSLDGLKWASNLTIQDVGSLSVSNLTSVNGSFIIAYNTFTEAKFPALEEVGGSVQIFANDDMTNLTLSELSTVGGELRLYNNTELTDMEDTFESLEKIKGAVNIVGAFSNLTMSQLEEVDGDFTVSSTSDEFDCDEFKALRSSSKIKGHNYSCSAKSKSSSSSSGSSKSSSGSSSGSSGSSSSSSSSGSSSGSSTSSKKSNASNMVAGSMLFTTLVGTFLAIFI